LPGGVGIKLAFSLFILCFSHICFAQAVCARSSFVTLYDEPSAKGNVTWKVAKYMPFVKVDHKGPWIKVTDLDGAFHWARSRDFRSDIRCVVVKTNVAKLRAEPKPDAPLAAIKTVERFTPFKRLAEEEVWILVEDESGNKAWISETNVWKPTSVTPIAF
jgi:SH3-like domain-containing protein